MNVGKERKRVTGVGGREKSETGMSHNSHVLFHCQLENKGSKVG